MARTRKVVQEHVERIKMAEVRNSQGLDMDEMMEQKPMLGDEQDSVKESPPMVEIPSETQDTLEKPVIITYSCEKCQRKFETQSGMRIHYDRCKKSPKKKPNDPQLHKCTICSANFTVLSRLLEHLNKHEGVKPFECRKENCNQSFHGLQARLKHEQKCKGNTLLDPSVDQESPESSTVAIAPEENQPKIFSCSKCPRKFDTKGGLVTHRLNCMKPVKSPRLHTCSICSVEFGSANHLDAHMNKHNDIKPYKCKNESCGMDFYGKLHLYKHTERCGKAKPVCPLCGLQLSSKATLHAHMKTHAGTPEAPVAPVAECETCGKKFKTKKSLKNHQTVHLNEWNYPCGECGKMLKTAASLSVHRRIHMEVKPFSCAVCGQGFTLKSLVERHMQKCHAEVVFVK
ncbi:zinc finger protein 235 [Culex quinquefasciatus]|uniref:zinc finger protein 235 n=1 Tax=Culex quinquefasciatus TaxID=7176 RepID=UPI0018E3C4DD|nr:zinc finger protein 235 [Culex quinquefasciatus]